MGKKKVTCDLNDEHKPPNDVTLDHHHHHHHHHHRHHNNQKPKKIKSEARLLHTLNSHFKKLAKCRSKKKNSRPSRAKDPPEDNKHHMNGHLSSCLKLDKYKDDMSCLKLDNYKDDIYDSFMATDFDHDDDIGVFGSGQELCLNKTVSFVGLENDEDMFGGDGVFAPDLGPSPSMVFEENGCGYGSGIPDPVMKMDTCDEGKYLYDDLLELSSQEDMINEFLKVNLLVS